ncbi:MAG TPA: hypothetical protein VD886_08330 [Herpetosiphonaceae bacterium]|nr:hypothetical protein [Herpetosiphonaceae bacterium]
MERLSLSTTTVERLRDIQAEQMACYNDPILRDHDVVVITYGLGPSEYLRLDGKILILDHDEEDPALVATADEYDLRTASLILARRYDLTELLIPELFPVKPKGASECRLCGGTRWIQDKVVCFLCRALGWVMDEAQPLPFMRRESRILISAPLR